MQPPLSNHQLAHGNPWRMALFGSGAGGVSGCCIWPPLIYFNMTVHQRTVRFTTMVTHADTHHSTKSSLFSRSQAHTYTDTDSLLNIQSHIHLFTNWIGPTGSSKPIQYIHFVFSADRERERHTNKQDTPHFIFCLQKCLVLITIKGSVQPYYHRKYFILAILSSLRVLPAPQCNYRMAFMQIMCDSWQ